MSPLGNPAVRNRNKKIRTQLPKSYGPHFRRIAKARTYAQFVCGLLKLVPLLLERGQPPGAIAKDLAGMARFSPFAWRFADCVAPIVSDLAMRRRKH